MKKITSLSFLILLGLLISHGSIYAQLTGTKTIPGDYATVTAAITDLNTQGVGAGGVTFNVAAGYTETNVNVVLTCATNPPSVSRPITFQKSGAGANPLLTAGVGVSTTTDGIWKLNGVTYVTIDGIDLQENAANLDATTQMEWGYALVKQTGTLACQFVTIKNCTITLNKANTASTGIYTGNHTATSTTALVVTSFLGTGSYNKFYNNTTQNSYFGYQIQGYSAAAPYDLYDQFNEIGTTAGGRSQVLNFGGGAISAYGIYGIYQNNMKIYNTNINSTGGVNSTATLNGIFTSTGTNSNIDIYGDTVTVVSGAASSQLIGINNSFGSTGAGNTVNIYNNVVTGCSYPTSTSGEFRGINTSATSATTNIYNNKVTGNTLPGTGNMTGIYIAGSSIAPMLVMNIYNNEVSGNSKSGTGGNLYCVYASSSNQATNFYGNNIFNNSAASTIGGVVYGYYNFAFGYAENLYNNNIYNLTGGTGETVGIFAKSGSAPTDKNVYGNNIYGLSGANVVGGMIVDYGTNANIYKNNVYNLSSSTTSLTQAVYGISYGTNIGQNLNINNNFISDLKSPANSNTACIMGLWIQGSASTVAKIYYNTVYLNATSSGAIFGTAAMYVNSTAYSIDMRNNVLVNVSTNATTGKTVALQRVTTLLTNYNVLSSNNCFYAGTPGASNLIHFDGTNSDLTLQNFKDRVTPREQASFSELPPFINVATTPYNLRMQSGIATQCESGAQVVDVTVDYDNQTRSATFPDVGADEFTGITTDIASPNIVYTNLTNDGVAATRTISSFALITDPSGINTTAGTRPRIYYKKSTNANTFNDNTSATDGWKWVEATNTSSPFSFTVNYANLQGGSVAAGDIIQYFVTAQDNNATPRIGLNAGAFTTQPTTVNLAAANFPLTSTINQYTITANTYTGTLLVGATETITSLTNAGGLFALINAGTLSGNITVNITSDLTAETGTFALNQWSETGAGGYTLTIQPSAAVTRLISGTSTSGLIRLDGADRVRIDGRSGGSGQYLTFRNISTSAATIAMLNDAQNNIVRNCILEGNSTLTSGNFAGVVNIGTTTGVNGNDNNTITYNEIRDRSDVVGRPTMGIIGSGSTTTLQQFNNNCTISNNNIHDFFADGSTTQFGIFVTTGNSGWNIDSNSIYQTAVRTNTITSGVTRGINIANASTLAINGGFNVRNNFIGGTAPGATGSDWTINVGGTAIVHQFIPLAMTTGLIPNTVTGNVIRNIDFTTVSPTAAATQFAALSIAQGFYTISGNTVGSPTTNNNIKITINVSTGTNSTSFLAGILFGSTLPCGMDFLNNTIGSITIAGSATTAVFMQVVQYQSNPVTAGLIQGNIIGSTSTANSIQTNFSANPQDIIFGIRALPSNTNFPVINNNIIQNITDNSTSTAASDFGILVIGSVGPTSNAITVTNNTIANISSNSGVATATFNCYGLAIQGTNGTATVTGNTISGIRNINAGVTGGVNVGIQVQSNSLGGTMSRNKIYDLTSVSTGTGQIAGIYTSSGSAWTYANNMISMTNGEASLDKMKEINAFNNKIETNLQPTDFKTLALRYAPTANYVYDAAKENAGEQQVFDAGNINNTAMPNQISVQKNNDDKNSDKSVKSENNTNSPSSLNGVNMYGIVDFMSGTTLNLYYNSIYVGGSATSGAFNSYAYLKGSTSNLTSTNNLFYNNRTGGTGFHYAIGNIGAAPSTGWLSSNYNAYVSADTSYMGEWGSGVNKNIDGWRTSSATDGYSWYAKNTQVPAASLFTSLSAGNLVINTANAPAWLVKGKGIAIASINNDYSGNARSTAITNGTTCIGASEFTAVPPSNPNAYQSAAPSSGGTTDYVLFGRKIASITWGTGGTYPTSMNVNYYSGVSPLAPNVTNPQRVSNSYWSINPATGTFSGTTYDVTVLYADNETFSVTSPTTNIIMAKNDNSFWMSYPRGTGSLQSEQNSSLKTVIARGMLRFSNFTLTDAGLPAERPLTPVNNATNQPLSVTVVWNKSVLATSYRVQVATDSTFASGIILNDSTVTDSTKLVTGLSAGTNYFWRVNGKSGSGTGAWCQVYKFTTTAVLPPAVVNLTVIPGGFYNTGTARLRMRDTVRVYLVDSATCLRVDSAKGVLDSVNFSTSISFSNANTGNYYLMVYHRNHIAAATRFRTTVTRGSSVGYDFTTDSAKAFGFNMVKVSTSPVRWALIPGDANRDGFVDGLDQTIWIGQNGLDGYLASDFNGDSFIDGLDQTIWILYNGNSSFLPCGFTLDPVTNQIITNTADYDAKKSNKIMFDKKRLEIPEINSNKQNNNRK